MQLHPDNVESDGVMDAGGVEAETSFASVLGRPPDSAGVVAEEFCGADG